MFDTSFLSARLNASRIQYEDWPGLLTAAQSGKFPRELALSHMTTEQAAKDWHRQKVIDWQNKQGFVWSVRWKNSSEVIGQVSLVPRQSDIALAYWIAPDLWGLGIVTEILKSLLIIIYESEYQGDIWAAAHPWNTRSLSVLVKLGFKYQKESQYRFENGNVENMKEYLLSACR